MEEKTGITKELKNLVLTAEQFRRAVYEAKSFKSECVEIGHQVNRLAHNLRKLVRLVDGSSQQLYERPIRRVIVDVKKNLERSFALVQKCKRHNLIWRFCTLINAGGFRKLNFFKVNNLLESSYGDVKWILSVFDSDGGGIVLSLPPISMTDPILPWVWSLVASIQMGKLPDKIDAANHLASHAGDSDRNKKIIIDEGGVGPLLKLLKESSSEEAQIAVVTVLGFLACDGDKVRSIVKELGIPIIVEVLADSSIRVQIKVASLVARMAEHDRIARDEFGIKNVIKPLVTLLSLDLFVDNDENLKMKHELKVNCAEALWMLARENVENSRRITETKGLLSLAKIVEKEAGKLQYICLMILMEITAAAESDEYLRRAAFKTNSPAAKAVIDQMLWIIKEVDNPNLKIPAIHCIRSLARAFPARETRIIEPLVGNLGSSNEDVLMNAVVSLQRFICPQNYLCAEHSKNIIEYGGIPVLMKLIGKMEQKKELQCLALLCHISVNASKHEQLEQAEVLSLLEGAKESLQNLKLRELVGKAINQLNVYNAGSYSHMLSLHRSP